MDDYDDPNLRKLTPEQRLNYVELAELLQSSGGWAKRDARRLALAEILADLPQEAE